MRILHTSDWHVGKRLGRVDRMDDHAAVLDELVQIAEEEAVDLVLVAGDLFDRPVPPVDALRLVIETLRRLASERRPVVAVAGNHDSAEMFELLGFLLRDWNIHLVGEIKPPEGGGVLELQAGGERALVACFPYLREGRAIDFLSDVGAWGGQYAARVAAICSAYESHLEQHRDGDTVTLLVAHFVVSGVRLGGQGAPRGERPLELVVEGFRSHHGRNVFSWQNRRLVGIVGPIGSGKSSILDAICFALFGKTPVFEKDRAVLLAQNRFTAFLGAAAAERDRVLKGLFGFDRVDLMRQRAKARHDEAAARLAELRGQSAALAADRARCEALAAEHGAAAQRVDALAAVAEQLRKLERERAQHEQGIAAAVAGLADLQIIASDVPEAGRVAAVARAGVEAEAALRAAEELREQAARERGAAPRRARGRTRAGRSTLHRARARAHRARSCSLG